MEARVAVARGAAWVGGETAAERAAEARAAAESGAVVMATGRLP